MGIRIGRSTKNAERMIELLEKGSGCFYAGNKKAAILLPIEEYNGIMKELEELRALKTD